MLILLLLLLKVQGIDIYIAGAVDWTAEFIPFLGYFVAMAIEGITIIVVVAVWVCKMKGEEKSKETTSIPLYVKIDSDRLGER